MCSVLKMIILLYEDKFEDTKEAIRIHKSEKDIQYNRQHEKDKNCQ